MVLPTVGTARRQMARTTGTRSTTFATTAVLCRARTLPTCAATPVRTHRAAQYQTARRWAVTALAATLIPWARTAVARPGCSRRRAAAAAIRVRRFAPAAACLRHLLRRRHHPLCCRRHPLRRRRHPLRLRRRHRQAATARRTTGRATSTALPSMVLPTVGTARRQMARTTGTRSTTFATTAVLCRARTIPTCAATPVRTHRAAQCQTARRWAVTVLAAPLIQWARTAVAR